MHPEARAPKKSHCPLLRQLPMKLMRYRWRTQEKPEKANRERKAGARGEERPSSEAIV